MNINLHKWLRYREVMILDKVVRARVTEEFLEEFYEVVQKNGETASNLIRNWMYQYIEENKNTAADHGD